MTTTAERAPRCPPTTPTRSATRSSRTRCRSTPRCATPARSCYLSRYDVYAMARYEQVHAALVDWQEFQSAAGVGPVELPLREAVAPAEPAAGGRPAAPRRPAPGAAEDPRARARCAGCASAGSPTPTTSSTRSCAAADARVRRRARRSPRRSRCGCSPTPSASRRQGRENLLPYGDHLFNAFGPPNDLVAKGAPRVAELSAWVDAQCARDALAPDGFGARHLGRRRPRRHHPRAGAADRPLAAHRRRRHHRPRPRRRPVRVRHQPRPVAAAARRAVAWRGSRSTRPCAGSRRCRPSSAPPPPTSAIGGTRRPGRQEDPDVPRRRQPRPPALGTDTRPDVRPRPATRPATSGSAWASTSASASTSPASRPRPCSPRCPPGRAHRARRTARRHHNNTLRAWESIPVSLSLT